MGWFMGWFDLSEKLSWKRGSATLPAQLLILIKGGQGSNIAPLAPQVLSESDSLYLKMDGHGPP
jgi:hypothetical protein